MDKPQTSLILKIGIGLLLIGSVIPFILVKMFNADSAVGPILMIYVTFFPAIALIIIGTIKTFWDRRKNKNNIS